MKLIERVEINLEWLDADKLFAHPEPKGKRSTDRIHVSEVIRAIAIQSNLLTDADRDDEMPVCVLLGMGWEMICARLYPSMEWQPGEVVRDGVAGSPDGQTVLDDDVIVIGRKVADAGELVVDEFKYTKKSCRKPGGGPNDYKDLNDEWMWTVQGLSYCGMHELEPRLIRYHVLWARGNYDYKGGGAKERYIRYLYRVSDQEVERNWGMIQKHIGIVEDSGVQSGARSVPVKSGDCPVAPELQVPCVACGGSGMSTRKGIKCWPCRGTGKRREK